MSKINRNRVFDQVRAYYPDWKWLKKRFAEIRIKRFLRYMLSDNEVFEAERNIDKKKEVTAFCKTKWKKHYAFIESLANDIITRAPRYASSHDTSDIRIDMMFCHFAYGFLPDEYLCYDLEKKGINERQEIVSHLERFCYVYQMNDVSEVQVFNNKAKTYLKYKDYYKRDAVFLQSAKDFEKYKRFQKRHPVFVKKDIYGSMGNGVELIDTSGQNKSVREQFDKLLKQKPVFLEERIIQHEQLSALHPSSVNTVRFITMNTKNGIEVPYCFMKIGRGSSFVDNGGAGGILVGISRETGKLDSDGVDELNVRYTTHPDTGITFLNYQLPFWEQAINMCKEMSAKESKVKFIGWDFACTPTGWIVVEGNGMSQLIGPQTIYQRGVKKEFLDIMSKMDLIVDSI